MRFSVLGPLEVRRDDGGPVPLGGPQPRALLAALLLSPGQVVSTDRLTDCLWGDDPPAAARTLLHGCVAQLRRALAEPGRLLTRPPGYLLAVGPGELDRHRLDELEERAARATDPAAASAALAEALALWRGPVLQEVGLGPLAAEVTRLEERRLAVLERWVDAELRLGRPLVAELRAQVGAHPLRERLWAQLMIALYAEHRQAEALAAYASVRALLIDQLGVEPGDELRRLERAVLAAADPATLVRDHVGPLATGGAGGGVVPAELPAAAAAFTGRAEQLRWLDGRPPGGIAVVAGPPGVGKTALALHWGHRVRDRFPEGQLYVDLRGYSPEPPLRPAAALAGLLQALDVPPDRVPADPGRAAGLYRSLLAGRRVLVLLDDAADPDQVRPLLPGGPGCLAVVTSRDRLAGLVARDGAAHLELGVLSPAEAVALLGRVLGPDRVRAERSATARLAAACGRLPLALRVAAAHLVLRPERTVADQLAALGAGDGLAALRVDRDERTAVAAAFDLSYAALDPPTRRVFRLLGDLPGPDVTAAAVAAATGAPDAAAALDRLAGAHLVTEVRAGRYAPHALLRRYAADRGRAEDGAAERAAATGRLLAWYAGTAEAAATVLAPTMLRLGPPAPPGPFADHGAALAWLDAERAGLVAAARHAGAHGPYEIAWRLTDALRGYFWLHPHAVDWGMVARAGLAAARAGADPRAEAMAELALADRALLLNRHPRAVDGYARALALAERAGWPEAEAAVLGNLGSAYWKAGRLVEAADACRRALDLSRRVGPAGRTAGTLGNLAGLSAELGRLSEAAGWAAEALALFRRSGARGSEAVARAGMGEIDHLRGRLAPARWALTRALAGHREVGDRANEAGTLRVLALVHRDEGRPGPALAAAEQAVAVAVGTGDTRVEADARTALASVHDRLGRHAEAVDGYERALRLTRGTALPGTEIEALVGLAQARRHRGELDDAGALAGRAAALAAERGYRVLAGQALTVLATVDLDRGRPGPAAAAADRALDLHRDTGHRVGEVRTLLVRGRAHARAGRPEQAAADWHAAERLATELALPEAAAARDLLAGSAPPARRQA